jgi:hypothetical protein
MMRKSRCLSSKPRTTRSEEDETTGKTPTRPLAGKLASAPDFNPNGLTRMLRIASNFAIQPGCPENARRVASGASSVALRTSIENASLKSADGNTLAQSVGGVTALGRTACSTGCQRSPTLKHGFIAVRLWQFVCLPERVVCLGFAIITSSRCVSRPASTLFSRSGTPRSWRPRTGRRLQSRSRTRASNCPSSPT